MDAVIVGIEALDESRAAFDFALKEAALRGARLRIVRAWDATPRPGVAYSQVFIAYDLEALEQEAERTVSLAVEQAARLEPDVQAEGKAVFGEAAANLIDEANAALEEGAEVLLVVQDGHRGRLAARSTAHQLLGRAPCPLTIVRPERNKVRRRLPKPRKVGRVLPAPAVHADVPGAPVDRAGEKDFSMLSVADIARLGNVDEEAVSRCVREDPHFPRPVVHLSTGDLYDRYSIYKWAIEAGLKGLEPAF
jgi:nucleotide-binding universal stress UspA family protein